MTRGRLGSGSQRDESGVFQVVEAILVAVLVATALIFFALVQKPPAGSSSEGQDLAQAAADALHIKREDLMAATTSVNGNPTLDEDEVRAALNEVLPDEVRYVLHARDADGPGVAAVGPTATTPDVPRNAQAAATYIWEGEVVLLELVVWNGV